MVFLVDQVGQFGGRLGSMLFFVWLLEFFLETVEPQSHIARVYLELQLQLVFMLQLDDLSLLVLELFTLPLMPAFPRHMRLLAALLAPT